MWCDTTHLTEKIPTDPMVSDIDDNNCLENVLVLTTNGNAQVRLNGNLNSCSTAPLLPNSSPSYHNHTPKKPRKYPSTKHIPTPRLVSKTGEVLLKNIHIPNKTQLVYKWVPCYFGFVTYVSNFRNWFHLIIEYSWRTVMLLFTMGFVLSWLFFGTLYYVIAIFTGDLSQVEEVVSRLSKGTYLVCHHFSMESQNTIGYGHRYMRENCPLAYIILSIQIIFGLLVQTILTAVVIAKMLRPKKRRQEMRFSQFAVIGPVDENDHRPALMIRLADIQSRLYLAESHVRLFMACSKINHNGQRVLVGLKDMNVGYDGGWDRVLLLWPIIVRHVIDEDSPMFGMSAETMKNHQFELIMTVEGIVEATGMTFQARTSFLPDEINWGQRFVPIVVYSEEAEAFQVDYSCFECTEGADPIKVEKPVEDSEEEEHHHRHSASGFV
uniref:Inward rectifier potassium channel irk-1 n=1 Tax=Rhabditophanes sp. KR3021 TaxID=114890 RepID=A0AC35UBW2_9BILA